MSDITVLEGFELIPVLELQPGHFATQDRQLPSGSILENPEGWYRYWADSLADSGLTGLSPVSRGSWCVATSEFADPAVLRRLLEVLVQRADGMEVFSDPEYQPPLDGGLVLRCRSRGVLVEPGCCADLGDIVHWRDAAAHREVEWHQLWIGHPWISVRYETPWLIISDAHEAELPTARWAVSPEELQSRINAAHVQLEQLAQWIAQSSHHWDIRATPNR